MYTLIKSTCASLPSRMSNEFEMMNELNLKGRSATGLHSSVGGKLLGAELQMRCRCLAKALGKAEVRARQLLVEQDSGNRRSVPSSLAGKICEASGH